jgi:large subunit ribosomal protein L21
MYAVIETGGKQYRVEVGTEVEVELLDVEPGTTITLDRVLLVADGDDASIGRPVVDGAAVSAEVVRQTRGDKVIAFKYRPKARRRVKKGHRQDLTVLRVSDIVLDGKSAAKAAAKAQSDAKTERARLEEAAAAQAAKDAELAAKLAADTKASVPTKKPASGTKRPSSGATATTAPKATSTPKSGSKASPKATTKTSTDAAKPAAKPRATKPRTTKKDE